VCRRTGGANGKGAVGFFRKYAGVAVCYLDEFWLSAGFGCRIEDQRGRGSADAGSGSWLRGINRYS
jgi:hypothetical protein